MAGDDEHLEGEQPQTPPPEGDPGEALPPQGGGADDADDEDEFDVAAFFAAGANSPGAVTASPPADAGAGTSGSPGPGRASSAAGGSSPGGAPAKPAPSGARPLNLPELSFSEPAGSGGDHLDLLSDVDLNVTIELGRTRMLVEDVLRLGQGSVVELDKLAGDPVDVYVNERLVAKGEVLVLNENFCVRINELVSDEVRRSA